MTRNQKLPPEPPIDDIRRMMRDVQEKNEALVKEQFSMLVGTTEINGRINTLDEKINGCNTSTEHHVHYLRVGLAAVATLGLALFGWGYKSLDDKMEKYQATNLEKLFSSVEKINTTVNTLHQANEKVRDAIRNENAPNDKSVLGESPQ